MRNKRSPSSQDSDFKPVRSPYFVLTTDYLVPILVIIFSLLVWFIAFRTAIFHLSDVKCEREMEPCNNPYILSELEKYKSQNLLTLNVSEIESKLKAGDPTISRVLITKQLPRTLSISITSSTPSLALRVSSENTWILLDENLRVVRLSPIATALPTLEISEPLTVQIGQAIESDVGVAAQLLRTLSKSIDMRLVSLDKDLVKVTLADGIVALLTTQKDVNNQVLALQAVLRDDTIDRTKYRVIDVRFDKPVLKSGM